MTKGAIFDTDDFVIFQIFCLMLKMDTRSKVKFLYEKLLTCVLCSVT